MMFVSALSQKYRSGSPLALLGGSRAQGAPTGVLALAPYGDSDGDSDEDEDGSDSFEGGADHRRRLAHFRPSALALTSYASPAAAAAAATAAAAGPSKLRTRSLAWLRRRIAQYAGVPTGRRLRNMREAARILREDDRMVDDGEGGLVLPAGER